MILSILALTAIYSSRRAKDFAVKVIYRLLPNYVDLVIYANLGPVYVTLIEISTDGEDPNYGPNPQRQHMPKVALLEIQFNLAKKSHFHNRHCLIGYELITETPATVEENEEETPAVYWHTFSLLFMDFYLPATGPFAPL
ncbi:hypothetical protein DUE52_18070 [Larkinella punicea]|uniref:Uncharacterized protein n=2 Tax=Larkinella punicea TaxID=2315727 RepID=A0A368JL91_9BACT|nr:hypothetical protein DUE52_18070 [Larkinella punicea]